MQKYDVIVIGSGSGALVADAVAASGMKTALIDKGLLGGTCLNVGCIPSKMLIYPADKIAELKTLRRLGIKVRVEEVDFAGIMRRMRSGIRQSRIHMEEGIRNRENLDYYKAEARFVDYYTLEAGGETLVGERIVLATGARPLIPPIKGLDGVKYLTNESALGLKRLPESLLIIGGGYIAVEFGHFFAAMGTKVTIVEMAERLLTAEEPEISALLQKSLSQRMKVMTGTLVTGVRMDRRGVVLSVSEKATGMEKEVRGRQVMIAVGRTSNADTLDVAKTGVELDGRGFIRTDDYLQTTTKNIYAIGDANGKQMFRHVANMEAYVVVQNILHNNSMKMDYMAAPHAVYSYPQIASVGLTESAARQQYEIAVGTVRYSDVAKGEAMGERDGFAKAIIEKGTGRIVGFHIIGPYAPELIQEVVNAMQSGGHVDEINRAMHIHPALSELIVEAVNSAV